MPADPLPPVPYGNRSRSLRHALWRLTLRRFDRLAARRRRLTADAFAWHALARGGMVGAVAPSSRRLAQAMAQAADGADRIVELGAGTGAVTAALVARHGERPMTAVEIDAGWADALRRRFPSLGVCGMPADQMLASFVAMPCETVVLVSSLPFRSLPAPWYRRTRDAVETFLLADPRRRLVQYTYQPRAPFEPRAGSRLVWRCRRAIWANLPPAWIWELQAVRQDEC